MEGASQDINKY